MSLRMWLIGALLCLAFSTVLSSPVLAQESTTTVAPGGVYNVEVTVQKPSGMTLSSDWEIRAYVYSGSSYYTTGNWWSSDGDWIYSGTYEHRIRNQQWSKPDEKTFSIPIQLVNYPRGSEGPAYPPELSENEAKSAGYYMDEILDNGNPKTVTLRVRLIFRNLSPEFTGNKVKFKIAGTTYEYSYQKDQYDRYWLKTADGEDVGSGGYIDQSSTGEWRLNYRQDVNLIVSANGPSTGTIVVSNPIVIGLSAPGGVPLWMIGVGAVIVIVAAVVVLTRKKKEMPLEGAPELPPTPAPPTPPPAPSPPTPSPQPAPQPQPAPEPQPAPQPAPQPQPEPEKPPSPPAPPPPQPES